MDEKKPLSPEEARKTLWHKGILVWKLYPHQREVYDLFKNNDEKLTILSSSRRIGKSFLLLIIASEICLQKERAIVKYITPEQKMAKTIIKPLMERIFQDAPKSLKPEFKTNDKVYRFPNGSEIQIAGTDNGQHESIRGGDADLCIVDEAGFCDDLDYVIKSVLIPTTTLTKGKILLSSTPPRSPDHEFINYIKEAEAKNKLIRKTIYDNPQISKEEIYDIIKEYEAQGGENSSEFRREYLAEIIIDEESAVIPEFTEAVQKEIVKEWPRPPLYDIYVAMDIGFTDLTFVLFAYYDFQNAKLVIEDELVMNGPTMTTDKLAEEIRKKEAKLFVDHLSGEVKKPFLRICDNNLILINDLQNLHNLLFLPTSKDDAHGAINNVRMKVQQKAIIINPRCVNLIRHLKGATWNKNRTSFDRSHDNGHYDGVDALKYLVRNVIYTKNPYPNDYFNKNSANTFTSPHKPKEYSSSVNSFAIIGRARINK